MKLEEKGFVGRFQSLPENRAGESCGGRASPCKGRATGEQHLVPGACLKCSSRYLELLVDG